ncbi:MAG: NAD(P)-dependent glycerol-3-phosphate dehydrogenase [Oscillospiraceae bacterium]|nr:NAD(P)-dependent glycerol-3-phosphate dehydrogenase [Oscillospiraceae bacterium]
MKITVLGSGGWGTALALLLHENGHEVTLWSAFAAESDVLQAIRENPYLPGISLPDQLVCTADMAAVRTSDLVILATPSFAVRETARAMKPLLVPGTPVVVVSKGIERETLQHFSDVVRDELGVGAAVAALSGPSHAEEVARKIPTACVAVSDDSAVAELVQDIFMNERFRVYTSSDVVGVELGAALKNVIAIAAGAAEGIGCGDNTIAALITRGLGEIATLAVALGGQRETLAGLAGLGDLIVTCTSRHSRNRRAGVLIGKGFPHREVMEQIGGVVEGYYAAGAAYALATKAGVEMPICGEIYRVLYEDKDPTHVLKDLMTRSKKSEQHDYATENWIKP